MLPLGSAAPSIQEVLIHPLSTSRSENGRNDPDFTYIFPMNTADSDAVVSDVQDSELFIPTVPRAHSSWLLA